MNTKDVYIVREQEIRVTVPAILTDMEAKQYALSYAKQEMHSSQWNTELGYKIYDENGEAI